MTKEAIEVKQHGCNSITPITVGKFSKIYQWAVKLSTEQGEENYIWTFDTLQLVNRLRITKGNLIAVIGLQGSGKTALRQALWLELEKYGKKVLCFKWGSLDSELLNLDFNVDDVLKRLIDTYDTYGLARKLKINHLTLELFLKGELTGSEEKAIKHLVLKLASREERREVEKYALLDAIQTKDVILIDFPDYSKTNQSQMVRDLNEFAKWWEGLVALADNVYTHDVNVVVFFQKELFSGHFLFGKFDVFELKPMDSALLMQILKHNCGGIEPFTKEALEYLAGLSRGIIRRFKKYVRICLERAFQHSCNSITVDLVKNWIGLEQLEKDMELELMDIFPRQKELRKCSVILLQLLNERKAIPQKEIAESVFDGNKMKCSRVLEKLEAWNYIEREWESTDEAHQKIVKLKGVC